MKNGKNAAKAVGIIALLGALIFAPLKQFDEVPLIDAATDEYFEDAIVQAGAVYTTARVINGAVSVLKESTVDASPAGVGVTVAVGQILDPIDDMVERLSDILISASISLGAQKVMFEIARHFFLFWMSGLGAALLIISFFKGRKAEALYNLGVRLLIILAVARFMFPISALASSALDSFYFAPAIEGQSAKLSLYTPSAEFTLSDIRGSVASAKDALASFTSHAADIIGTMLSLAGLYVGVFFVQVIFIPIAAFWVMVKISNRLFAREDSAFIKFHTRPKVRRAGAKKDAKVLP